MLVLLSPSKTLEFSQTNYKDATNPGFFDESLKIIKVLAKLKIEDISQLMDLSEKLAQLNYERYQNFSSIQNQKNSKPAIFSFKGDVYDGLDVDSLTQQDIDYAQRHLRILSGLYGILRPLDLIQPYRLEMGTRLVIGKNKNLYQFWGDKIAEEINQVESELIVNLASNEYFKAVNQKILNAKIITPIFKEKKGTDYKIVMLYAKQARGAMANFIIKNKIDKISDLKEFNQRDYKFSSNLSSDKELIFIR